MKKTILALSLFVGVNSTAGVFATLLQNIRIDTDTTYVLFSPKDAKRDFVGFGIDLGSEPCSQIRMKCIWVGDDFNSLTPFLKAKEVDAIVSSLSITEKHQQEIAFSDKLYTASSRLIAAKELPIRPTLEVLKSRYVGVLQGLTQEAYANNHWRSQDVDVVAYQNQDLIYSDLAVGRLDAALQGEVTTSESFLKQPAGKDSALIGPSVENKKYSGDGTGIGLCKGDIELKTAFDKASDKIRKDGTYDKMAKKYFNFNVYGDQDYCRPARWRGPDVIPVVLFQNGATENAMDHFSAKTASFLAKKCIVKRF